MFLVVCLFLLLLPLSSLAEESVCFGTTSEGWLEGGVKLPADGENFQSYSSTGNLLGRTYVHSRVRDIIVSSYAKLKREKPEYLFVYGETGWEAGGRFRPHKTHQNGLSVDFMVPVKKDGKSEYLPTGVLNKFGYDIEFTNEGKFDEYTLDYEAMAAHLHALHQESLRHGVEIWRVIFAPELQPKLFQTTYGDYLKKNLQFSKKRSWVRHDEHYHVDFKIDCEPFEK